MVCDRPEQAAVLTSSGELLFELNSTNRDIDREEGEQEWRLRREEPLARLGQGEFCLVQVKVSWFLSLLKKYFRYFIFLDALASLRSILFSQSVSESVTFSDY